MKNTISGGIVLVLFATAGCGGSSSDSNDGNTTPDRFANPADSESINGFVRDSQSGARLAGVTVKIGTQTTTDSDGRFNLSGLSKGGAVVSLVKANYAPGYENVTVGESAEAVIVPLKKEGTRQTYNRTAAKTISETTEAGPYAVIFSPNTLDTTDTNLHVAVTPLDPTKESANLPGNLAVTDALLEPLTFAEFSIFDSAGNRVNLMADKEAAVELPIPPTLRSNTNYGSGFAYVVGALTWDQPADGSTVNAANLTASWLDSGSSTTGYSAVYWASIIKQSGTGQDFAYYLGTNREFSPKTATGSVLSAGTYRASLTAFSGAFTGLGTQNFSVINNITGATITGQFFSYSSLATPAEFTVQWRCIVNVIS